MTSEQLKTKLIQFSPFTLEVTNEKFVFYNDRVEINDTSSFFYNVLEDQNGLEIKIDFELLNFFNVIVVFGQTNSERQIVNFNKNKLFISLPQRPQFVGLVSSKIL